MFSCFVDALTLLDIFASSSGESRSCVKVFVDAVTLAQFKRWIAGIAGKESMSMIYRCEKHCLLRSLPSLWAYINQRSKFAFNFTNLNLVRNSCGLSHRDGIRRLICTWASGKSWWLILNPFRRREIAKGCSSLISSWEEQHAPLMQNSIWSIICVKFQAR